MVATTSRDSLNHPFIEGNKTPMIRTVLWRPPCRRWNPSRRSCGMTRLIFAFFFPMTSKLLRRYGGFLKWWYPTTIGFPTKNYHFGVFWWYHDLRKHPYGPSKTYHPNTEPQEVIIWMSGGFLLLGLFFFERKNRWTMHVCLFLKFLRGRSSPLKEEFMIGASFGNLLEGHDVMSLIWDVAPPGVYGPTWAIKLREFTMWRGV